jgi:hypothetical protein
MNKKLYILSIIGIVILLSIIIFLIVKSNSSTKVQKPDITITAMPTSYRLPGPTIFEESTEYAAEQDKVNATISPIKYQTDKRGELLDSVPHKGTYFVFDYDNRNLHFIVTYDKTHANEAIQEFNVFLNAKQIQRSWLTDLKEEYK